MFGAHVVWSPRGGARRGARPRVDGLRRLAIDAVFRHRRQFLVRGLFFVEVLLQQGCAVLAAELLRPRDQAAVAGDLVVLNGLGGGNQGGIQHALIFDFPCHYVRLVTNAVDGGAVHALGILALQLKHAFQPLYVILGFAQMGLETLLEMDLRRQIEHVATMRAKLPPGGGVPTDYIFEEGGKSLDDTQTVRKIRLSELFGDKQTLVAYSYMYGPQMAEACPNCTSIIDGLNGAAEHIGQRVSLVVIAKSPIARIREMARQRGWHRLRLLSSAGNSYNHDYKGEKVDGSQIPSLNVFIRKSGKIHHFFNTELCLPRAVRAATPVMWT